MLCVTALCQWLGLLLANKSEMQARDLLSLSLEAAGGGALQPFQSLLQEHPLWLREQLLMQPASPVQASLLALLPAPQSAEVASGSGEALSAREKAVLELIAQGCSNQEISERLFISLHTVKTHASHINSKLGVERRTQAVARAKVLGLLA
jgi:LuxR family maltose regulon positive regulatory protein